MEKINRERLVSSHTLQFAAYFYTLLCSVEWCFKVEAWSFRERALYHFIISILFTPYVCSLVRKLWLKFVSFYSECDFLSRLVCFELFRLFLMFALKQTDFLNSCTLWSDWALFWVAFFFTLILFVFIFS